jgi:predicted DNA binding protein
MKKAELVELAESMGVSTSGTKKDLIEAILGA